MPFPDEGTKIFWGSFYPSPDQRCADTVLNICILFVSIKNYLYPYPIHSDVVNCYPYPIRIRSIDRESKRITPTISAVAATLVVRY